MFEQALSTVENWFTSKKWSPFPFQKHVWQAVLEGKSGLLNSPTGSGKTYALFFPVIIKALQQASLSPSTHKNKHRLKLLWITPLRALAKDLTKTMQETCEQLGLDWQVEQRTGDISSSAKQKQQRSMPEVLIITPESLHILLAQKHHEAYFSQLDLIVVDEWHELLGSKRGVLTQLGIALLLDYRPKLSIWGISATIDNLDEALDALVWGKRTTGVETCIIKNPAQVQLDIETLIPDEIENFPSAIEI